MATMQQHLAEPGGTTAAAPRVDPAAQVDELWRCHGRSVFGLACTVLGDEGAAIRAVALGMHDLGPGVDAPVADVRRRLARHVYGRSQELVAQTPRSPDLPPVMRWVSELGELQRASLALCVFGGHTHREAAAVLGVPSLTVAHMLTSGLQELGRLAPGASHQRN